MAGVRVPVIPMSAPVPGHAAVPRASADERLPTLRDPDLLIYFREDGGGLVMGGYERDAQPAFLPDGTERARPDPAGLQRPPARGRLGPVRRDHRELEAPGPGDGRGQDHEADQRPRGVHARQRVLPRRVGGARLLRRRGLLRPRARRRRRDRPRDRRVDRRGRAEPRPLGDGRAPLRRPVPLARLHPRAHPRDLRDLLRHPLPEPRALRRAAAADVAARTPGTPSTARRSARSRAGSGSTGTSRTPPPATSRCARAAGRASTGRLRSAPSTGRPARRWRSSTRARSRSSRSRARAAARAARAPVRQPGRARGRQAHLHADAQPARRDRVRLHRRPARAGAVLDRHRDRVRKPRSRVDPQAPARGRRRPGARRHLRLGVLRDLGAAGARRARAADARRTSRTTAFPYMSVREITIGNVPVRALRVTYVGELGWEIYCPTEYGLGLWRTLWEAGEAHGLVAGGYRAIDSLRLEKGYRVWGADITPDETPYEGGVGFCVKLDKEGGFIGREALVEAERARSAHAALLPGARRPALGRARQRAGPHRRRDRRPRDHRRASATRSSARSPTPTCRPSTPSPAPRSRSRSSASGSRARSPREPLFDPGGGAGPGRRGAR